MWLFLAFLAVPMIEIALFIQIGGLIGLLPTLLIVILTAVIGTSLVRSQGRLALGQMQHSFQTLKDPTEPLAHGAMILFAGALLLTPGFFTDACGLLLLIPSVRARVFAFVRSRIKIQSFNISPEPSQATPQDPTIIEGDFSEVDPVKKATHQSSGWTKH